MPRAVPQQYAFNAGEVSPLMLGRQDVDDVYPRAMRVCLNGIPLVQGGWTRRPGTVYLNTVKFGALKNVRLFPFEYNTEQIYQLEFGDEYIRFFTEHGIVVEADQVVNSISKASPGVANVTTHGYSNGDRLFLFDIDGMSQVSGREVQAAGVTANTFQLTDHYGTNINSTNFDTFVSGSVAKILELTTPYQDTDLNRIKYVQSADVMYLFHEDYPPAKLIREAALTWTLEELVFLDGPYMGLNTSTTTLTLSGTSGSVTVTASAATGINNDVGFLASDVDRLIRWQDPAGDWTWLKITARASPTSITATILGANASGTTATLNWRLGLYSETTGFPRTGWFHENRLVLAGCPTAPSRVDGSRTGDYENFTPTDPDGTVVADHAFAAVAASGRVDQMRWLVGDEKGLLAGTAGGEFVIRPSALSEGLSPTNISIKQSSQHGVADEMPVRAGNAVLFVQRGIAKLRELAYVFEKDGFRAPDLTVIAEHISRDSTFNLPALGRLAYQQQPNSIIWTPRDYDGVLLGLTYERDQNALAWHRHILGGGGYGIGPGAATHPSVEDCISTIDPNRTTNEVYLVVTRGVNGITQRYIEYMTPAWLSGATADGACYFDCSLTQNGAASTVEGLWFLEGETVGVWADGATHAAREVENGKITLDGEYDTVTVGCNYNSDGQTLPLEAGSADGTAQSKTKRIDKLGMWLLDTVGLKIGRDFDHLNLVKTRVWGDDYGEGTPLFSGVLAERFEGNYDKEGSVCWRVTDGCPATILALMPYAQTEG